MNTEETIKKNSLKTNMIFQTLYQLVILIFPMIVSPYLTRVLGEGPLGEYTYSSSIAYYFIVLAALGINQYGQRVISQRRDDETKLRKTFWSLYLVHICLSVFSILAFVLFAFFFDASYKNLFYIEIIYVASSLFDITWLFYGLENFKSVVWKNALIKVLESICIFWLVKSASDLWIYTLIMSLSTLLGQAVLLPKAIHFVKPITFGWPDIKEHIKPLLVLSIAAIASTLYTVFDKTLLGAMTNTDNVAYYEYSNKIINIPKSLMAVITIVFFPRACANFEKKDFKKAKRDISYSLNYICFLGFATIFGLLSTGELLVKLYYGESFEVCGGYVMAMSVLPLIILIGDVSRSQFLVPNHKDGQFTVSICLSAIINLILSACLIPTLGVYGAIIGTICAELFSTIYQMICTKKFISIPKTLLTMIPYLLFGFIMYTIIFIIKIYFNTTWIDLLLQILVGALVYSFFSFLYLWFLSPLKGDIRAFVQKKISRKNK